jgi:hypothetical protein
MSREGDLKRGAAQRLARARQRARKLRAEGRSYREIAELLGCSLATAHAYATHEPSASPPPPPEEGNQRATRHGVWSKPTIGELQEQYRVKASARWEHLSGDDLEMWCRLSARVQQAASFETEAGALAGDRVHGVSTSLTAWESKLAKLTAEHDREAERRREEAGQRSGGEHGRRDHGRLAGLMAGPCVSGLVAEMRGRLRGVGWRDLVGDAAAMDLGRRVLREVEGTPDPPEPEPDTERPGLDGRPAPLGLPAAPDQLGGL